MDRARPESPRAPTSSWVGLALLLIVLPLALLGGISARDLRRASAQAERIAALDGIDRQADDFIFAMRASQVALRDYLLYPDPATRQAALEAESRVRRLGDGLAAIESTPSERPRTTVWQAQLRTRSAMVDSVLAVASIEDARRQWNDQMRPHLGDTLIHTAQQIAAATTEAGRLNSIALQRSLSLATKRGGFLLALTIILGASGAGLFRRSRRQEQLARESLEMHTARAESIRAELRSILDGAEDMILRYEPDARMIYVNATAARIIGKPNEELVGAPIEQGALTLDNAARWRAAILRVCATGAPEGWEFEYVGPSGLPQWISVRLTPVRDLSGQITGVVEFSRDLTDVHRAAEALANREAELRAIVDGMEDLLMRFDREGRIDFLNPAYSRAVGRPASYFLGQTAADVLVDPAARDRFTAALGRTMQHGVPETLEFAYHRPGEDASRFYVTRFTPLRDSQGTVTGVLTLSHDLTERRATELERERLLDELLRARAALTTLKGLLPTCSWCHKIRDEHGHWEQMESYIARRSEAEFSHGLCPDCATKMLTE